MTPWRDTWHPSDPQRVCYGCGAKPSHRFKDGSPGYPMTCDHPPITATPEEIARWEAAPQAAREELSRWRANRQAGIQPGWVDEDGDTLTMQAENYVAAHLGVKAVGVLKGKRDPGWDLVTRKGAKVDVKHTVHENGHLAVKTWKPRKADIYVLVTGRTREAFTIRGWATRAEVEAAPVVDQGYTNPDGSPQTYFNLHQDSLRPLGAN